tara:strand:- start:2458 stop:2703 length:246 start_codon:yes stop_codon:yes gene_type:complete
MEPKSDAQEKDLACRLAYEFILESVKEDQEFENLEFVNKELPHKTIDKLINHFEKTEEYEKCSTLQKIKYNRLLEYSKYNL